MRFGFRELIFVLVLLAMPVATYIFVFEPRNAQIVQARKEVMDKQAKLQQLEAATRSFADLGKEIDKLTESITLFEQKLPAARETEVILKQVTELAATHKLTTRSIRPDKVVSNAQYSELPIRMVIAGDFDGYYSFLLDMEKLRRITRIPEMKLKKTPNDEGQMEADMVLNIYFEGQDNTNHAGAEAGRGRL
jgi:type IV pilus assembly protein PilO